MHYCHIASLLLTTLTLLGLVRSAPASESADSVSFVSFQDFIQGVKSTSFNTLTKRAVQNEGAFMEMRSHIVNMYAGVTMPANVTSFVSRGQHVDCIAITEQPSVFHLGIKQISKPPQPLAPPAGGDALPSGFSYSESLLGLGLKDQFGNAMSCPEQTIPMSRLSIDRLTQFSTLSQFFAKPDTQASTSSTNGSSLNPRGAQAQSAWDPVRKLATGEQTVINYGGNAWIDVWNSDGDYSSTHQRFSGGSPLQTIEGGSAVYPQLFRTLYGTTYIHWSSGTKGCYNLDCVGFVQTSKYWHLGGTWDNYSTPQRNWGYRLQWKLIGGEWWFFMESAGHSGPVGYIPAGSVYGSGQLSRSATHLQFGGEVGRLVGDSWPQMGSGTKPPVVGYSGVAGQYLIYYDPRNQDGGQGVWPTLSPRQDTPCYAVQIVVNSTANGGTIVRYGGGGEGNQNLC